MDLEVSARHALFFDDDAASAFVNSPEALVPWSGDASLLIDRYDVRHLLPRIPPRPSRKQQLGRDVDVDGVSKSELDAERYLDLPDHDSDGNEEGSVDTKGAERSSSGGYQAVPFSYGNVDDSSDRRSSDVGMGEAAYHPPFPLPENLLSCLPPTEKLHQIIARTSLFVSKHGGQSEIILRVKQGDNPTFGFLMPTHHLHAYFRFLVDHPELLTNDSKPNDTQQEKKQSDSGENESQAASGALSLLGSVYGCGDDDDTIQGLSESKETALGNQADAANSNQTQESERTAEAKISLKALISSKENTLCLKKNQPIAAVRVGAAHSKIKAEADSVDASATKLHSNMSDLSKLVVEPPSSLKQTISKIVEFIMRNGKEFEAILIEQDRSHGRFPFLLQSNLYHSYYIKVLNEAHEAKRKGRSVTDEKHDSQKKVDSPRKSRERRQSVSPNSANDYNTERKEKFKMANSGSAKDSGELCPKPTKERGVSVDVAAAIVMAATRGLRSPREIDDPAKQPGLSTDATAAIVRAATRGSSSPTRLDSRFPQRESDGALTTGQGRCSSSFESFAAFLHGENSIPERVSISELGASIPADKSVSTDQLVGKGIGADDNVMVANVIAKSAALAAASEADSSEASLTEEQKRKAERLKRAKMFAALIKSGGQDAGKLLPGLGQIGTQLVPPTISGSSDQSRREREGSSVPEVTSRSPREDSTQQMREEKSRKCRSSKDHDADFEEDQRCLRKKHRSEHSSRSERDDRKHKRHHSSSKSKHDSSSEDEHHHKKRSRSHRHHHKHHDSSDDDHHHHSKDSHRHRRKSHSEKEVQEAGVVKTFDRSKATSANSPNEIHETMAPSVSDTRPGGTEVSDELRAKIRAMLLATM